MDEQDVTLTWIPQDNPRTLHNATTTAPTLGPQSRAEEVGHGRRVHHWRERRHGMRASDLKQKDLDKLATRHDRDKLATRHDRDKRATRHDRDKLATRHDRDPLATRDDRDILATQPSPRNRSHTQTLGIAPEAERFTRLAGDASAKGPSNSMTEASSASTGTGSMAVSH